MKSNFHWLKNLANFPINDLHSRKFQRIIIFCFYWYKIFCCKNWRWWEFQKPRNVNSNALRFQNNNQSGRNLNQVNSTEEIIKKWEYLKWFQKCMKKFRLKEFSRKGKQLFVVFFSSKFSSLVCFYMLH